MERINKENYYLDIAETVLKRGTCLRRNFGAVIVNNDQIISSGYTGSPRGRKNCLDLNICVRKKFDIPRGERYELCRSVHAEANAIIHASREKMLGGTLYLVGKESDGHKYVKNAAPCAMCKKLIINSGLKYIVARNTKNEFKITEVKNLIENDESLNLIKGY